MQPSGCRYPYTPPLWSQIFRFQWLTRRLCRQVFRPPGFSRRCLATKDLRRTTAWSSFGTRGRSAGSRIGTPPQQNSLYFKYDETHEIICKSFAQIGSLFLRAHGAGGAQTVPVRTAVLAKNGALAGPILDHSNPVTRVVAETPDWLGRATVLTLTPRPRHAYDAPSPPWRHRERGSRNTTGGQKDR